MDLEGVAEELYRLPPARFTSARNARATQLTRDGDRDLASAVRALPKATASAWAVDAFAAAGQTSGSVGAGSAGEGGSASEGGSAGEGGLAGEGAAELRDDIVALGDALRAAQEHPDRTTLTELNDERRAVVNRAVAAASALADDAGVQLTAAARTDVEQTFFAAVADPKAAAAVFSGRLVRPLQSIGLDEVDLTDAVGGPEPRALGPTPRRRPDAAASTDGGGTGPQPDEAGESAAAAEARRREREEARAALRRAEKAVRDADEALGSVDDLVRDQTEEAADLAAERDDLNGRLARLDRRQNQLAKRQEKAAHQQQAARSAAERARAEAEDARSNAARFD
ncbi:hypothetical protein [Subtercola sp. YIM 133946]|uniref:hypothetical protein n=1 Tax=Subtercola sp. YIM 133946 TaxID=3118909 RepID=UPI002F956E28